MNNLLFLLLAFGLAGLAHIFLTHQVNRRF